MSVKGCRQELPNLERNAENAGEYTNTCSYIEPSKRGVQAVSGSMSGVGPITLYRRGFHRGEAPNQKQEGARQGRKHTA